MKTTKFSCSTREGGMVPVLHDVYELHVARCQPVETMTVGTSSYVLRVTNPTPLPDAENPSTGD